MKTAPILALLALALLSGCSSTLRAPADGYDVPPVASVAEAEAAIAKAQSDRIALEAEFAASEARCYERFFVNRCLDEAKERRRQGLVVVRAIEVAMERYRRQAAVDQRDRELAQAEAEFQAQEAARAAAAPPPRTVAPEPAPTAPSGISLAERRARHAAKLRAAAEKERAEAPMRAAKAAAYQRKKEKSERRQAEIAAKQAQKARAETQQGSSAPIK